MDLDDQDLFDLLWADVEDEPEFDSETAWFRYAAETLFQISIERIVESAAVDASEFTMWVKGRNVRYSDASAGPAGPYGIIDIETNTFSMVMPATRSYVQYTMDEAESATRDMMESMGIDPDEAAAMEDYEFEDDEETGGVWLEPVLRPLNRRELVNGLQASAFQAESGAGPSAEDLLCEGEFPVRLQILTFDAMAGGLQYSVNETLSVERTAVDDGMFEIPDGYTRMSLSDMWRLLTLRNSRPGYS